MKKFKRAVAVFLALAVCLCLSFGTFGGNDGTSGDGGVVDAGTCSHVEQMMVLENEIEATCTEDGSRDTRGVLQRMRGGDFERNNRDSCHGPQLW